MFQLGADAPLGQFERQCVRLLTGRQRSLSALRSAFPFGAGVLRGRQYGLFRGAVLALPHGGASALQSETRAEHLQGTGAQSWCVEAAIRRRMRRRRPWYHASYPLRWWSLLFSWRCLRGVTASATGVVLYVHITETHPQEVVHTSVAEVKSTDHWCRSTCSQDYVMRKPSWEQAQKSERPEEVLRTDAFPGTTLGETQEALADGGDCWTLSRMSEVPTGVSTSLRWCDVLV